MSFSLTPWANILHHPVVCRWGKAIISVPVIGYQTCIYFTWTVVTGIFYVKGTFLKEKESKGPILPRPEAWSCHSPIHFFSFTKPPSNTQIYTNSPSRLNGFVRWILKQWSFYLQRNSLKLSITYTTCILWHWRLAVHKNTYQVGACTLSYRGMLPNHVIL